MNRSFVHNNEYCESKRRPIPKRNVKYYYRHIMITKNIIFEDGFELICGQLFETDQLIEDKNLIKLVIMKEGTNGKGKFERRYDITDCFEYVLKDHEIILDVINTRMEAVIEEMNRTLGEYKLALAEIKKLLPPQENDEGNEPGEDDGFDDPTTNIDDKKPTIKPETPVNPPSTDEGNEQGPPTTGETKDPETPGTGESGIEQGEV